MTDSAKTIVPAPAAIARHRSRVARAPLWTVAGDGRLIAVLALVGALAVIVARVHPPVDVTGTWRSQLQAMVRITLTCDLVGILLIGPGLILRGRLRRSQRGGLLFVPVPGVLGLGIVGLGMWWATWQGHDLASVRSTVQIVLVAVLLGLAVAAWAMRNLLVHPEVRVLGIALTVFTVALGRAMWSLGPAGELYGGSISRTMEPTDRSDSRISYHVTSLVMNGYTPFSPAGASRFLPYNFSDRGPIPGLAASPLMVASGTTSTGGFPDNLWQLFDPQGFMVYRIFMMMLALTALLAVWSLARCLWGDRVALLSVVVVAGTPFFVHDVYFTWPKWAASAGVLMAAYLLVTRRRTLAGLAASSLGAGLCVGYGFMMHPLALLSAVPLGALIVLLGVQAARDPGPIKGGRPPRPAGSMWSATTVRQLLLQAVPLGIGTGVVFELWKHVNGVYYTQSGFVQYFKMANNVVAPVSASDWVDQRLRSIGNTLVPLEVPLTEGDNPSINSFYMHSDAVVHFFYQYWVSLPFGGGILFFPVLLWQLVRLARRWPWTTTGLVLLPFVFFAIYWGSFRSGLLREGLHPWVLTVLIAWSVSWLPRLRSGRAIPWGVRLVLVLRPVEVLLMMTATSVWFHHGVSTSGHRFADVVAIALMVGGLGVLMALTAAATGSSYVRTLSGVPRPGAQVEVDTATEGWRTAAPAGTPHGTDNAGAPAAVPT